jgi:hypothetical protein
MSKTLVVALTFSLGATLGAAAQDGSPPPRDLPQNGGAGIRSGNITATGETVPNPGASQSAGTTEMDRGVQREDNKIQSSICKGC